MSDAIVAPMEVKFADDGAQPGTFEGYGAFFANKDSYGDVIQKGAFKETLKDWKSRKRLPPMLSQHGGWMMSDMDAVPVGKWESMAEDESGLYVKGRLINLDTERGKNLYGAMREGVMDGMSIGYRAKEFAYGTKPDEPRRTLKKVDIIEVSIVTFPANDKATIRSVKSLRDLNSEDFREIEASLRTKGLSRTDAVKAVS
ncbi:MAG: HK97 family phage prohead protease, partial [Myxococcales bacterium]|nr:HK97 family phage prohead protease [Myxococcales bacterium]